MLLRTQCSTINKDVKNIVRSDKKTYVDNLAEEAEQAAGRQDLKSIYSINKTPYGRYTRSNVPVGDKEFFFKGVWAGTKVEGTLWEFNQSYIWIRYQSIKKGIRHRPTYAKWILSKGCNKGTDKW